MRPVTWFVLLGLMAASIVGGGIGQALAASTMQAKLSQQVAGGGVTVTATLLKNQEEATAIELALNTHSVNLDGYRWEAIATLRDDGGRIYPLQAVENASGGGHHRQAVLRFGRPSPEAKTIELIVKGVAGVPARAFRWSTTE